MELLSTLAIPVVLALVGVWGLCRHVAVFPSTAKNPPPTPNS